MCLVIEEDVGRAREHWPERLAHLDELVRSEFRKLRLEPNSAVQQQLLDLLPREQRHDEAVVAPVSVKSTATIVRVAGIEELLPIEQPPLVHHFLVTGAACGDVRVAFGPDCPPRVPDHERLAQDGAATQLS